MRRLESSSVAGLFLLAVSLAGCGEEEEVAWKRQADGGAPLKLSTVDLSAGQRGYVNSCALCHGTTGLGDGPMSGALDPPPRGFVNEEWRFIDASTPEKLREGINRVIHDGLPDSGMPASGSVLTDEQISDIAEYVLILHSGG